MRSVRFLVPVLAAAGFLFSSVFSGAFPFLGSSTRTFSLDGLGYTLLSSGESDFSLVRRELAKSGLHMPRDPEEDPPPHPALTFAIARGKDDRSPRRYPIPDAFTVAHALRLADEGGEVEVIFGTATRPQPESVRLLRGRGWSCPDPVDRAGGGRVVACTHGKERLLAFLEAKGERFLLVRRVDR